MDDREKSKIEALEKDILTSKPWQLKGEVTGRSRPFNSLIHEKVAYEKDVKAPTITAESTEQLEEIIKQRIKDSNFDDPIRKHKTPVDINAAAKRSIAAEKIASSEKSKLGLADVYEQQIYKSILPAAENKTVKEVGKKLDVLLKKLNALSEI